MTFFIPSAILSGDIFEIKIGKSNLANIKLHKAKTPFSSNFANLHPRFAPFFITSANYFLPELLITKAVVHSGTMFVVHL